MDWQSDVYCDMLGQAAEAAWAPSWRGVGRFLRKKIDGIEKVETFEMPRSRNRFPTPIAWTLLILPVRRREEDLRPSAPFLAGAPVERQGRAADPLPSVHRLPDNPARPLKRILCPPFHPDFAAYLHEGVQEDQGKGRSAAELPVEAVDAIFGEG
jgi:hypothetical protein